MSRRVDEKSLAPVQSPVDDKGTPEPKKISVAVALDVLSQQGNANVTSMLLDLVATFGGSDELADARKQAGNVLSALSKQQAKLAGQNVVPEHGVGQVPVGTVAWLSKKAKKKEGGLYKRVSRLNRPIRINLDSDVIKSIVTEAISAFREAIDGDEFADLLASIAKGEATTTTKDQRELMRGVKAAGDHLRASFRMLDHTHEVPKRLHQFIRDLGRLKDAAEAKVELKERAEDVLARRDKLALRKVTSSFQPIKESARRKHFSKVRREIIERANAPELSAHEFHTLRKQLRDLLHIMRMTASHHEKRPKHARPRETYDQLNELLGAVHDCLVDHDLVGEDDYEDLTTQVPPEIAKIIVALIEATEVR